MIFIIYDTMNKKSKRQTMVDKILHWKLDWETGATLKRGGNSWALITGTTLKRGGKSGAL